jgi:membrane fusion protein (multidrug efflux system)
MVKQSSIATASERANATRQTLGDKGGKAARLLQSVIPFTTNVPSTMIALGAVLRFLYRRACGLSDLGHAYEGWEAMEFMCIKTLFRFTRKRRGQAACPIMWKQILVLTSIYLLLPGCHRHEEHAEAEHHKIVVTSPQLKDVIITQQYVCQIHSQRQIKVCALVNGYLEPISVKEGQHVREGEVLFSVLPVLYKAKWDAELAEAKLAELELKNTERLANNKERAIVSQNEVLLYQAKFAKAEAKAKLAGAEWNFTKVIAPYDGLIDRLHEQQGSFIKEGDVLTTLSDNNLMWVYFNLPEKHYLEYMAGGKDDEAGKQIELMLADGSKFPVTGKIGAIEARFNNETGTIPFRADFPNPKGLLRHGMTGNVLIHRTLKNAIVIPQRAIFEILDRRYVYVVDEDNVPHQRPIVVQNELDDIFVIKSGLNAGDKIVYEGTRQVHDGEALELFEFRPPEQILGHQKNHAE